MIRLIVSDFLDPFFLLTASSKFSIFQIVEIEKIVAEKLIEFARSNKITIYKYSKSHKTYNITYNIQTLDDFTIFLFYSPDSYIIIRYPPYHRIKEFIAQFLEYCNINYSSLQEYLYSLYYILNPP